MGAIGSGGSQSPMTPYPQASAAQIQGHAQRSHPKAPGSSKWMWWVVGLLVLGAAAGAVLALVMR